MVSPLEFRPVVMATRMGEGPTECFPRSSLLNDDDMILRFTPEGAAK